MQGPPTSSIYAVTVQSSTSSMQIPIQLIVPSHTMKAIDTCALIDSGANISCIDWDFVKKHQLPTIMLGLDRDEHRPSEVKGLSHTGLLVMRTCTRTSWQGSKVQGKRAESPSK